MDKRFSFLLYKKYLTLMLIPLIQISFLFAAEDSTSLDDLDTLNNSFVASRRRSKIFSKKKRSSSSTKFLKKSPSLYPTEIESSAKKSQEISTQDVQDAIQESFFDKKSPIYFSSYIRSTTAFQGFSLSPAVFKPNGIDDHYILGNGEGTVMNMTLGLQRSFSQDLLVTTEFGLAHTVSSYYGAPVFFMLNAPNQTSSIKFTTAFVSFHSKRLGFSTWLGLRELNIQDVPIMTIRLRSLYGTGIGIENILLSKNNSASLSLDFLTSANPLSGSLSLEKQTLFLFDTHIKNISIPYKSAKLGVQFTPMILMNVSWQPPSDSPGNPPPPESKLPENLSQRTGLQIALSYQQDVFWFFKNRDSSGEFLLQFGYGPGMNFSSPFPYSYASQSPQPTAPPNIRSVPEGSIQDLDGIPIHARVFYYGTFDILEDLKIQMVNGASFIYGKMGEPLLWLTSGIRPAFHLNHIVHIQTEYSLDITQYYKNPASPSKTDLPLFLNKFTIAPGMTFPGKIPGNPTISLFGTLGFWNKTHINSLGVKKNPTFDVHSFSQNQNFAFSWGFQIEASL